MRLVVRDKNQRQIFGFALLLKNAQIPHYCYKQIEEGPEPVWEIWVEKEEDLLPTQRRYNDYSSLLQIAHSTVIASSKLLKLSDNQPLSKIDAFEPLYFGPWTVTVCILCSLFLILSHAKWTSFPLFAESLNFHLLFYFDLPQLDNENSWTGLYPIYLNWLLLPSPTNYCPTYPSELFICIRQGQWWRLFTPNLMHANLLHLGFNLIGWVLTASQIEKRLGSCRILLMTLLVGIISCTAQYLAVGWHFLGLSGIVFGIWAFVGTHKYLGNKDGYTVPNQAIKSFFAFGLLLCSLEVYPPLAIYFDLPLLVFPIANTSHLAGTLTGATLACIPFFYSN